jgi:hypothetical protein
MNNIELRWTQSWSAPFIDATRIGDTEYYRVEQALNEMFYTVKIVKFC